MFPLTGNDNFSNNDKDDKMSALLGVSVHHLCTIFQPEVMFYASKNLNRDSSRGITIYDIEDLDDETPGFIRRKGLNILSKNDDLIGASYVETLEGADNVGFVTHMLSHSWGSTIDDIVESLVSFCETRDLNTKRTYIWLRFLCTNQAHKIDDNSLTEHPAKYVKEEVNGINNVVSLIEQIVGINNVLSLMVPWNAPVYLRSMKCIYELYIAIEKKCNFAIIMPPRERKKLMDAIKQSTSAGTFQDLVKTLSTETKIEDSEAPNLEERSRILRLVNSYSSCAHVNETVNSYMTEWINVIMVKETVKAAELDSSDVETDVDLALIYNNVGLVYNEKGNYNEALDCFQKGQSIHEKVAANTYSNIGDAFMNKGDYDKAREYYIKCMVVRQKEYGIEDPITAMTYNSLSTVYYKMGDYNLSLEYGQKCFVIWEMYNNLSSAHYQIGDYSKSLEYGQKCSAIWEKVYGSESPYDNIRQLQEKKTNSVGD